MIVASLLLIVVAVTLLVVGLAAGSSTLLIASIVASLFAAIALVIGARQAAGRAAATGPTRTPLAVDLDDDPGPAGGSGETGRFAPIGTPSVDPSMPNAAQAPAPAPAASGGTVDARSAAAAETVVGSGWDPVPPDRHAPEPAHPSSVRPDAGRSVTVPDETAETEVLDRVPDGDDVDGQTTGDPYADFHREQAATARHDGAGVDQGRPVSSDMDPAAGRRASGHLHAGDPVHGDPVHGDPVHGDPVHAAHEAGVRDVDAHDVGDLRPAGGQPSGDPVAVDDDEDPADEPAPQRTQPADAVRVSRMVAEVLVVDGRPRYHLGDCPSLSGRITEPLPVAEAVELGFTPCSMCRPVDRLVAEAVPR